MEVLRYRFEDYVDQGSSFKYNRYRGRELTQPLHMHDYFQLAYIKQGVCQHEFCDRTQTVSAGDLLMIAPAHVHSLNTMSNHEFDVILLDFIPCFLKIALPIKSYMSFDPINWLRPSLHIPSDKQMFVEQLLQDIAEEYEMKREGYLFSLQLSLLKLIILANREFHMLGRREEVLATRRIQGSLKQVIRYVHESYDKDITLEHAAQIACISPTYFSHIFKKEVGQTFIDFIQQVRIERAQELIRHSDHSITSICFLTGFRNLSHFIRTFKKRTGATPSDYKKWVLHN